MSAFLPYIVIGALGLCIGSFLNVVIYRLPAGQSIIYPGSACPHCRQPIRFYDNLPLLSYVWLRGRCRSCKVSVPLRYPLVELLGGLAAAGVYHCFGVSPEALLYFFFIAALITISFIDIDHRIIPDVITLPGIPVCLGASFLLPSLSIQASLWGLLAGGGSLLLVAWGYHLMTGKEGMGGGDIKLLAMIGALLGWEGVLFTIFSASASGTLVGLAMMLRSGRDLKLKIPFGPFLSLGAIVFIFWGRQLLDWYLQGF